MLTDRVIAAPPPSGRRWKSTVTAELPSLWTTIVELHPSALFEKSGDHTLQVSALCRYARYADACPPLVSALALSGTKTSATVSTSTIVNRASGPCGLPGRAE